MTKSFNDSPLPDYYQCLGLEKGASDTEIKKAYRKLAMKMHPDKGGCEKLFHQISESYEVLSCSKKKRVYDLYGHDGLRGGQGMNDTSYTYNRDNAVEMFRKIFGDTPLAYFRFDDLTPFNSRAEKAAGKKADPIISDLPCTLEELFHGCTKKVRITRKRFKDRSKTKVVEEETVLSINVKRGWKQGTKIAFKNEGDETKENGIFITPADVILVVKELKHPAFIREGSNLVYTTKLMLSDALNGCILDVQTLQGNRLCIKMEEIVHPDYEKRIVGEGMPIVKTPEKRGDLLVRFSIVFPKFLNADAKRVIREQLEASSKENRSAESLEATEQLPGTCLGE